MFRKFDLPRLEDDDHHRFFSSKGWLIYVSRRNHNISLFYPVSGKVIKPPSLPLSMLLQNEPWDDRSYTYHFFKFILTGWPSCCDDDIAVAMIFDVTQRLAVWKPGEHKWTVIPTTNDWIYDVCFFKGEFYAIDHLGKIIAFGVEVAKRQPRIVVNLIDQGVLLEQSTGQLYLVEAESTLLVIHRYVHLLGDDDELECPKIDEPDYWTTHFEIYELDVDNGKAKKVEGVGDRAIFVGLGSSTFSVDASLDKRGCKANCIYFTDDNEEAFNDSKLGGGGGDMGIYNLAEGKIIERFYKGPSQFCFITPPIWVERPHY